jgi:DUF4097 and DUF4098 domain-containing protein YvlB
MKPPQKTVQIDEEEMERRRQEMMGNAKQRDEERERVVHKHREELKKEQDAIDAYRKKEKEADFIRFDLICYIDKHLSTTIHL